ncbi:MAG: ATP-binding protein, partial [Desulfobacterales bacterium]|nr:ATP-binding protein [Desulfobacterales bacterium]
MKPHFNVAGPCVPGEHYMLPARERCQGIPELIDRKQYFVIHAARQSGKTTLLQELAEQIEGERRYHALYCSLETIEEIPEPERGVPAIMASLAAQIRFHPALKKYPFTGHRHESGFNTMIRESLSVLCGEMDKPLILFFDEVDCLSNGTLIAFLRQLRDGYVNRR